MKRLLACLALIGVLVQAHIVYPQAMEVHSVDEDEDGACTVTLSSKDGLLYGFDADSDDWKIGELAAVLMYDNMTASDLTDDEILAVRHTGFFDARGAGE